MILNAFTGPRVRRWLYRSSLIFFLVFFVGFCSVMPIDSISRASKSTSNYALNTFVVVGALVIFGIVATVLTSARIYMQRSALQDIPKRYVPIDNSDMPHYCFKMIDSNFQRCEKIRAMALKSTEKVMHPGLSSPDSELLPPLLPFEDVVRAIGMKLKWDDSFFGADIKLPPSYSFREMLSYLEELNISDNSEVNREYADLFEELRYSGKLITQEKFLKFMELSIDFVKITRMNTEYGIRERRQSHTYSDISVPTDGFSKFSTARNRSSNNFNYSSSFMEGNSTRDPFQAYEEDELEPRTTSGNVSLYRTNTSHTVGTTNIYY